MENTMQFQKNATVFNANGDEIGHITRVVLHPDTKVLTHVVVRKKKLFEKDEKLMPIDQIADTSGALITLRETAEDLDVLPSFEEKHFIMQEGTSEGTTPATQVPTAYGVPLVNSSNATAGKYVTVIEQNIPPGTVAVKEGAKVVTAEGKNVGKVESIMANTPDDQATHLVVTSGVMTEEKKLVPIQLVDEIDEKEIRLNVNKDSVKELENVTP